MTEKISGERGGEVLWDGGAWMPAPGTLVQWWAVGGAGAGAMRAGAQCSTALVQCAHHQHGTRSRIILVRVSEGVEVVEAKLDLWGFQEEDQGI